MTTFEHALLGVNGLLASGWQHKYGWKMVALAGVAAVVPDWDGLPMLVDMARFEHGHRVWGHNLLACCVVGLVLATIDYCYDIVGRLASWCCRWGPFKPFRTQVEIRERWHRGEWAAWMLVAVLAALTQIPADAVVSGAAGLSDWKLKPLWPFSAWELIYPMVPWGNIGITMIFSVTMIFQVKFPQRTRAFALASLSAVFIYILLWGTLVS